MAQMEAEMAGVMNGPPRSTWHLEAAFWESGAWVMASEKIDQFEFCNALIAAGLPVGGIRSDGSIWWTTPPSRHERDRSEAIRATIATRQPETIEEDLKRRKDKDFDAKKEIEKLTKRVEKLERGVL